MYLVNRYTDRGIAQLVEHRSPKPSVVSSNLTAPAIKKTTLLWVVFLMARKVDENSRQSEFDYKRKRDGSIALGFSQWAKCDEDFYKKSSLSYCPVIQENHPFMGVFFMARKSWFWTHEEVSLTTSERRTKVRQWLYLSWMFI